MWTPCSPERFCGHSCLISFSWMFSFSFHFVSYIFHRHLTGDVIFSTTPQEHYFDCPYQLSSQIIGQTYRDAVVCSMHHVHSIHFFYNLCPPALVFLKLDLIYNWIWFYMPTSYFPDFSRLISPYNRSSKYFSNNIYDRPF